MPSSAWICPLCHRRVPRTVEECRCGRQWTGSEADADQADQRAVSPSHRVLLLPIAVVLLGLIAGYVIIGRHGQPAAAMRQTPGVALENDSAEPRPERSNAVGEAVAGSRVPRWPDDPTLWKDSTPAPAAAPAPVSGPAPRTRALEDVIGAALPAVVLVETPGGRGTGFFVAPDTVVTNAHVVEAHAYVALKLAGGESLTGRVVQRSDALDLAAIRTADTRSGQATLALATSRDARIGQEIFAIGSPLGLQNTVTRGIVSALRQAGSVTLVQTDAAINPGNSGGPLIDRAGRVVAVATMRMAGRAEALGFGVGAEHVRALLDGRAPAGAAAASRPASSFISGGGEDADVDRESGERSYERFLVEAAKRADQLDRSWTDFVADCLDGRTPFTRSDRGWYALWEKFDDSKVAPSCARFVTDFKLAAREFSTRMTEAADRARATGVYPGVCRQLRSRYRLDSPDW